MVAYSFKKQFGPPIPAGTKAQTIRAERSGRSRHARPGEMVQIYTGMRTRLCKLLGESLCTDVLSVRMILSRRPSADLIQIGDQYLSRVEEIEAFAQADGFTSIEQMVRFWWAEHPPASGQKIIFTGVLIRWQPLAPADALDISGAV